MSDSEKIAGLQAEIKRCWLARDAVAAVAGYEALLALTPGDAAAWFDLGNLYWQLDRLEDAEREMRRAISLDASPARYWSGLGAVLISRERWNEAAQAYRESLAREADSAANWSVLGAALWKLGELAQADEAYQRSLRLDPADATTTRNFARLQLQRFGRGEWAGAFAAVVSHGPCPWKAWLAACDAFVADGHWQAAVAAGGRAVQLAPGEQEVQEQLRSLVKRCPPELVEPLVKQIVGTRQPSRAALILLAALRQKQVRPEETAEALHALLLQAADPYHHGILLSLMQYGEGATPENLLTYHRAWDRLYAESLNPSEAPRVAAGVTGRRLRLGFLCSDFASHPVAYMVLPALERLDKARCEICCYFVDRREALDEYTERFRVASDRWQHLVDVPNEAIAGAIAQDGVDILFDLSGFNGKRPLVFAMKPAPLAIAWFGYPGTTGMRSMDYLLADRFHVRPGEEPYYSERVLRMPGDYACYEAPAGVPEVGLLPALASGRVTFGSFNNPIKITPATIAAWSRVLEAVPGSQLLLKYTSYEQEQLKDRIRAEFACQLIDPKRIVLETCEPSPPALMAAYERVDMALDTLPYSGGVTTCEALWMGVPTVTFPGRTFASRHATSHLTNAGFAEFVAADRAAYVALAVRWAGRLDELAELRGQTRQRMRRSGLCDTQRFADDLLDLLVQTWKAASDVPR